MYNFSSKDLWDMTPGEMNFWYDGFDLISDLKNKGY
jgi:hypothetical protein